MQQHQREVVRDIAVSLSLEQELQLAQDQHGVVVLDIYSSEWGNTKALSETFRRLYTDAGGTIYLRFYSVECNSVLESLNYPEEQRNPNMPKRLEQYRETFSTYWKDILSSRRGKSRSYFVLYKEGTHRASIEGVDTPKIISYVRELCRLQKPANECTSNKELLQFWEYYFSTSESEVFWESFLRAVQDRCALTRPLTSKEEGVLADAVVVKDNKVTIEAVDKWLEGEKMIETAFKELFVSTKELVTTVASIESMNNTTTPDKAEALESPLWDAVTEGGDAHKGRVEWWRSALWKSVALMSLNYPSNRGLFLLTCEKGEEEAKAYLQNAVDIPTLHAYLSSWSVALTDIHTLCHSAAEKIHSNALSYGKLALVLMLCDSKQCGELVGRQEDLVAHVVEGTLMSKHPPLAFTAICLCSTEFQSGESFCYSNDASILESADTLKEGEQVVLPPFSRLSLCNTVDAVYTVKVLGLPAVIQPVLTDSGDEKAVFTPWYAKFYVKEKLENSVTLTFVENIEDEQFQQFVHVYTQRLVEDEEKLSKSTGVVCITEHPLLSRRETVENSFSVVQCDKEYLEEVAAPVDNDAELSKGDVEKVEGNDVSPGLEVEL